MTLRSEIKNWDGKSADDIESIYDRHAQQPQFLSEIINHATMPSLQKGSTWLIKRHLERIDDAEDEIAQAILELIPSPGSLT